MVKYEEEMFGRHDEIFYCPHCGNQDVFFINMPQKCYLCGESHDFDVNSLIIEEECRVEFYAKGKQLKIGFI